MEIVLIVAGLYFTAGTVFFPIFNLPLIWRETFGALIKPRKAQKQTTNGISPYAAMATALASTVGTGNVAGVATAITMGGPGSIFWMWVCGVLLIMVKFAEVTLGVLYRKRDAEGNFYGGPTEYIRDGLGKRFTPLAYIFAFAGMCAAFGVGNMTQVNTVADSMRDGFGVSPFVTGIVFTVLAGVVILGGIKSIARVAEYLVPFMAGLYMLFALIVIIRFNGEIIPSLKLIAVSAFTPTAAFGGVAGYSVKEAVRLGMARGLFSHEAGMGSAPMVHAAADAKSHAHQGLWGAMEVIVDTLVICTLTALCILCSGAYNAQTMSEGLTGAPLVAASFHAALGEFGSKITAVATALFAFASVIGWAYYGRRCAEFLWTRMKYIFPVLYIAAILPGALTSPEAVWSAADILNIAMAAPNLVALFALSPKVFRAVKVLKNSK